MSLELPYADIEQQELYAATKLQANVAARAEVSVKQLATVLSRLVAIDSPAKQLNLLTRCAAYVDKIRDDLPAALKNDVIAIKNELQSLKEGIIAEVVTPEDMVVLSLNKALKASIALSKKANAKLVAISTGNGIDESIKILQRNQKFKESMPSLEGRDFAVARSPVSFTFQNKQKHGSVGYIDKELLTSLGFKAELLDGYAILHGQVIIGVSPDAVVDIQEKADNETGGITKVRMPITIKDKVVTFKAGKPTTVFKKRPKVALDVARELTATLSSNTGIPYELVSEHSASFRGGSWFWVMPSKDITRLGKAFPGGHIKLSKWGFAF